ncbi:hypothetical protein DV735_g3283, partial [Chaetothyriales sp. CBS 134920]
MAQSLSITASIVGVTIPALQGTRLLLEDLHQLKDAPRAVKRLGEEVRSVDTALELLKGLDEGVWESLGAPVAEHVKASISSHTRACDLFRNDLHQWTRHSDDGKLAWKDRAASVGFFRKAQITAMSGQLQSCQNSITAVVKIASLYGYVRDRHITEETNKMISTKQAELRAAITSVNKQLVVLDNKLEELSGSSDDDDAAAAPEEKAKALQQLEEGRKATDASRKLFDELLAKSQEDHLAKGSLGYHTGSTTITMGAHNSGLVVGIVNGGSITFAGK